ncbi:hypothetical protein GCM10022280_18730 [Sphingomonas swuensis]|uniref:Uncharacterized protein n=1 Tax=Sphingomonas swuensis TaxID=977800 RepID=A0ABP7T0F9_9SPHN
MLTPLQIQVERGGELIDTIERLLRRLPDGRIGAEYMGLVYPLSGPAEINLETTWCYPSEAPICLEPPELPSARARKWHLEELSSRSYLLLNGSAEYLDRVVTALQSARIEIEHWGPSFREDAFGRLHDWFIRLPAAIEETFRKWEIDQILAGVSEADEPKLHLPLADQLTRTQRLLEALLRRQAEAERQLAEALANADAQGAANREFASQAKDRERHLQTEVAFLRASVSAALSPTTSSTSDADPHLPRLLEELESERDDALARWALADDELQRHQAELRELTARLEELKLAPQNAPALNRRTRQRSLEELETTLRVLLPDVRLLRGSAEFVITEVEDRRDLYSKLRALSHDPTSLRGKRVHTADGWLEVHFSTGRGRDGRMYFKRMTIDGAACWAILVSDKAAQTSDISWLGGQ